MARIRAIKPEFWSSPDVAAVDDPWARLLFIAMWNWADDLGRGTANVRELAGFAFPHDEKLESADIRRMLGGIRRALGVTFYKVGERPYYAIPSWEKHQKIDKRSGAKHPGPEEGEPWDPDPDCQADLREPSNSAEPAESPPNPRRNPPSPRGIPGAGTGELGNRGTGEGGLGFEGDLTVGKRASSDAPRGVATAEAIVAEWRATGRRPKQLDAEVLGQVRSFIRQEFDPTDIREAVRLWSAKSLGAGALPGFLDQAVNGKVRDIPPAVPAAPVVDPDDPMTFDDKRLDKILGPDPTMHPPAGISHEDLKRWRVEAPAARLQERRLQVKAMMEERAAR